MDLLSLLSGSSLTRADSPLAKLLDKVSEGEVTQNLAPFRSAACQSEIEGMAALWPRTVFGYTELDSSSSPTIVRPSPWMAPSTLIVQLSRVRMTMFTRVESSESGTTITSVSEM